jgi:hypothetical protein
MINIGLVRRFAGDRRAAVALIIGLMIVPLLIASGSAVDFSRVASARAQLQAAADAGAIDGVGAYQTNQQGTAAYNTGYNTFQASGASVSSYATVNSVTVATGCNGSSTQCGTAGPTPMTCNGTQVYCVQVTAKATLANSLLAGWIPTDVLTVSAMATTQTVLSAKNFSSTNVANASDNNAIYAYPVPMSGNTPQYNQLPYPSNSCTGPITNGVLAADITAGTSSSTACQYYQIGNSTGTATAPQNPITVGGAQPIAFLFVNVTGNTYGYGYTAVGTSSGAIGTPYNGAGFCPIWNLYGSISQQGTLVPVQDSTHIYSSAYEMYGLPPTYSSSPADEASAADPNGINQPFGSNQPITPFTVPTGTNVGTQNIITGKNPVTGTPIYAAVPNYLTASPFQCPTQSSWTASYYPSNPYYSAVSGLTGPAVVGGCTPNTTATPWNYSGSNINAYDCDPGEFNANQLPTNVTPAAQTSSFSNCALLIEPLGTGVTSLPISYTVNTSTPETYTDPVSGQVTNFTATTLVASAAPNPVGIDFPPQSTAHQCYNPATGYDASGKFNVTLAEAKAYDYIENPGNGAIFCNNPTPSSYGLYWNDMGSGMSDDLGYWNAITLFTCSVPGSGGGPAILSQ